MVRVGYSFGVFYELWPDQKPPSVTGWRQAIINGLSRRPRLLSILTGAVALLTEIVCPNRFILYIFYSYMQVGLQSRLKGQARLVPVTG